MCFVRRVHCMHTLPHSKFFDSESLAQTLRVHFYVWCTSELAICILFFDYITSPVRWTLQHVYGKWQHTPRTASGTCMCSSTLDSGPCVTNVCELQRQWTVICHSRSIGHPFLNCQISEAASFKQR